MHVPSFVGQSPPKIFNLSIVRKDTFSMASNKECELMRAIGSNLPETLKNLKIIFLMLDSNPMSRSHSNFVSPYILAGAGVEVSETGEAA